MDCCHSFCLCVVDSVKTEKKDLNMLNELTKVHLFVGFGGSGGKTLTNFAKLATQNEDWAKHADKKVYFLLCDTDEDELNVARDGIFKAFEHVGVQPVVRIISLAKGIQNMADHVGRTMGSSTTDDSEAGNLATRRLKEVWWHQEGVPFKAAHLSTPPTEGASQCPPVASYLAWYDADALKSTVESLIQEMNNRVAHGGQNIPIDVTYVSSLAGGTGRGCWAILGFMIRRALKDYGYDSHPQAYFYDQSIFQEVHEKKPAQSPKLRVNSLTGLSEVVMWVRNDDPAADQSKTIKYFLPHLKKAGNPDHDVIKGIDFQGNKGKSPLNHAWVIFNQSRNGVVLRDMDDYYNMVAGCLYTQVATDISSMEANDTPSFGSAASAVHKVPINEIRERIKDRMVIALCDKLLTDVAETDSNDDLLTNTDFRYLEADANQINEKLTEILSKITDDSFDDLAESMEGKDKTGADEEADRLDDGCSEDAITRICENVYGQDSLSGYVKNELERRLATPGIPFAQSNAICIKLKETLDSSIQSLKKVKKPTGANSEILIQVKKWGKRDSILKGDFKRYEQREIDAIPAQLTPLYLKASEYTLAKVLISQCENALSSIVKHTGEFDEVSQALEMQKRTFEDDIKKKEERLYTMPDGNSWSVNDEHATPVNERNRIVERILRPIFPWAKDENDQSEGLKSFVDKVEQYPPVTEQMTAIRNLMRAKATDSANQMSDPNFRSDLKKRLDQLKANINIEEKELQKKFSFSVVVQELLNAWGVVMKDMPAGPGRNEHEKLFEQQFGTELDKEGEDYIVPDLNKVLTHMTLDLAKFCDPFMVLSDDSEATENGDMVIVSLPNEKDVFTENFAREMSRDTELVEKYGLRSGAFRPEVTKVGGAVGSPYMLAAFTQQSIITPDGDFTNLHEIAPFDNVPSMDYWQAPELSELLSAAECHEGTSMFRGIAGTYGLGFQDPRYLNDDYSHHRWAPWRNETSADKKRLDDCYDAILYALLGNVSAENTSDTNKECVANALQNIAKEYKDWTMPIIAGADCREFSYARLPMHNGSGGLQTNRSDDLWREGKTIGSVKKLLEEFGEERAKCDRSRDAVLTEVKLFKDNVLGKVITTKDYEIMKLSLCDYLVDMKIQARKVPAHKDVFVECIEKLEKRIEDWS